MIEEQSRILITGSSQGIGRALARHFASKGHKVFLLDIDEEGLQHTAETHLKEYSDHVSWQHCDISDVKSIRSAVEKAANHFGGRIDFLINNAGISHPYWADDKTMEDQSTFEEFQKYVAVNLTGNFAMSQAVIPYMKTEQEQDKHKLPKSNVGAAGPCILNISSFRGLVSDPNQEGYAATKGMHP